MRVVFFADLLLKIHAWSNGRADILFLNIKIIGPTPFFPKAETLRKRLVPGAREYDEVFSFIEYNGPPTNNHAERALRPLVIFRKVCMGTRSRKGSGNIAVFTSLTQTAKLQKIPILDLLEQLLVGSPAQAQDVLFSNSTPPEIS